MMTIVNLRVIEDTKWMANGDHVNHVKYACGVSSESDEIHLLDTIIVSQSELKIYEIAIIDSYLQAITKIPFIVSLHNRQSAWVIKEIDVSHLMLSVNMRHLDQLSEEVTALKENRGE